MTFDNKVVIITGASSGIGEATAVLFAREGANVVVVGRNETKLKHVEKAISTIGKAPLVIKADISTDSEGKRVIDETVKKYGKIDVLVNNAGFAKYGSILDGKVLDSFNDMMNTNVRAVINLTTLAAPHLIKSKGNIINVSSVAGLSVPIHPTWMGYCVSKAALDHFTKAAAAELGPEGVRVNSVNPGPVKTDFFENSNMTSMSLKDLEQATILNRVSASEEIADMIVFLAGQKAVGITGSIVVVDNGYLIKK